MKFFAISLILFASCAFSYSRAEREDYRLSVFVELYSFLEVISREIGCYLKPIHSICASYSSPQLFRLGFFSDIQSEGAHNAYMKLESKAILPSDASRVFREFFSLLGKGYAEDELKLAERALKELSPILFAERERVKKEKKLTVTLSSAAALGLIILLI